jgi:spermidine/putrescine transport system permease protein
MAFGRKGDLMLGLRGALHQLLLRTIAAVAVRRRGPVLGVVSPHLIAVTDALHITTDGKIMNTAAAVIGGLTYNFMPFALLPIYVSRKRSSTTSSTPPGPVLELPAHVPQGDLPVAARRSPARCLFHPGGGDFINAELLGNPRTR